jgi:Flp pilus assembly protein TadG
MMDSGVRRTLRSIASDEEGSALLEGTVLVPVLFSLIFGVLEFSHYFYQQHLVATGVRDAARYLARVQDPNNGAAQAIAQSLAATGSPTPGSTARRVTGFDPNEVTILVAAVANVPSGICGTDPCRGFPNSLTRVTVTGSFAWVPLGFWNAALGLGSVNVTVTHSERWIGTS